MKTLVSLQPERIPQTLKVLYRLVKINKITLVYEHCCSMFFKAQYAIHDSSNASNNFSKRQERLHLHFRAWVGKGPKKRSRCVSWSRVKEERKEGRERRNSDEERGVCEYGDGCWHDRMYNPVVKMVRIAGRIA